MVKLLIGSLFLLMISSCQVKEGSGSEFVSGHSPATNAFSFSTAANRSYKENQTIDFTLTFPSPVTVTGIPQLDLTIGGVPKVAPYISGGDTTKLLFRYTVVAGDTDLDGITVAPTINLNGGTLTHVLPSGIKNCSLALNIPSLASVKVDTTAPTVTSVSTIATGVYYAQQSMIFSANFSEKVFVTGAPRMALDLNGVPAYASYLSGSGSTSLLFRYTVISGDTDLDGIDLTSPLDLNAGSILDAAGNISDLNFTAPNTSSIIISGDNPIITSVLAPANKQYLVNQNIEFVMNFNEAVNVTGSPRISLNIGGATRYATYFSGSGTSAIKFRYVVAGGDLDSDGIGASSPIALNGGTIQDAGLNDAILTYTVPSLTGVKVYTVNPFITSITIPASPPTYGYDQTENIDFIVNFNEPMIETGGLSRLRLTVGSTIRYATYLSGSTTTSFTYRYTVPASDEDLDGVVLASPLQLNGSTIRNSANTNAILTFTPPNSSAIKVDARAPTISSNTIPNVGTYGLGQELYFDVVYSEPVNITGTPQLELTVGAATKFATYASGTGTNTIRFKYTVASGDSDVDGITLNNTIDLNAGGMKDNLDHDGALVIPNINTSNILIDTITPTITSIFPPSNNTYVTNDFMDFVVNVDEGVFVTGTPRLQLTIGGNVRYANYRSGSGTTALTFRYTVISGDNDADGIALSSPLQSNGGSIRDSAGNNLDMTFTSPDTSGILVDGITANIFTVTPPANGTYKTGNFLDFVANYTNTVNVTGIPRISLTVGSSTVYANYVSGTGTSSLTFRYIVGSGHEDNNGIAMTSPIDLNGGTIKDLNANNAGLNYAQPNTVGILVDGIDITVASITPPADGTYKIANSMDFTVNYSFPATVTGTPRLSLVVGGSTLYANYLSGSGSTAHTFRYTVTEGELDTDGININPPIGLNGGTIKDSFGDNATLTFTGTNYPNKKVDGVRPTVTTTGVSPNKTYKISDNIDFTLTFNENVIITGAPRLILTVGATTRYANYFTGSGTNTIVFRYSVPSGDLDTDGITAVSVIDLNAGTIADIAGNAISNLSWSVPGLSGVKVDGIIPTISSITPPASATYALGANLDWVVNFSEAVTITGAPVLTQNIGGATRNAVYLSGTGTTSITFRYQTILNDSDTNGVNLTSPILLSGGSIRDASGNDSDLNFTGLNYPGVLVDAVPPAVSSVTLPANGSYQNGGARPTMNFTVIFNETVYVTGTPRIALTIGSNTRYANYNGGTASTTLNFSYPIDVNDLDLDGIAIANSNNIDDTLGNIKDINNNLANRSLGSLATSRIFAVFPSMLHWWDLSDTNYITTNMGNVTSLRDKINTLNLSNNGSVPYSATGFNGGSSGFITCTFDTNYMDTGVSVNQVAIAGVFKAPTSNTGNLFWSNNNSRPRVGFDGGNTAALGVNGGHYLSGVFGTGSTSAPLFWTSSGGQYLFRAVKWDIPQSRSLRLCDMSGQLSEFFMFSSVPTSTELNAIQSYISSKHNGLTLP